MVKRCRAWHDQVIGAGKVGFGAWNIKDENGGDDEEEEQDLKKQDEDGGMD